VRKNDEKEGERDRRERKREKERERKDINAALLFGGIMLLALKQEHNSLSQGVLLRQCGGLEEGESNLPPMAMNKDQSC
jgi:hypothetical protein